MALTTRKNKLIITKIYVQHNHEISVVLQPFYSQKHRLTSLRAEDTEDVAKLNPDNKLLKSFFQDKYHEAIIMCNIRNLKKKMQERER